MILNSYAKLNLYLEVLNRRNDKYHNIKTVFERISLRDTIILRLRPDKKINITCNLASLPTGHSNLAYRCAYLLQNTFKVNKGVDIKIIKRIPVGAGLGGGSSNAASVLIGLNKLWGLNLTQAKLAKLAAKIGSDVPFFIYNTPFAQGDGRGDRIRPLKILSDTRLWHILVVPKIRVSTPFIYKKWDIYFKALKLAPPSLRQKDSIIKERVGLTPLDKCGISKNNYLTGLTMPKYNVKMLLLAIKEKKSSLISQALFNSLEQITAKIYPEINRIKEKLIALGVKSILMSGSGPAVFGVVSSRKEAVFLRRQLNKNALWQVFLTHTQRSLDKEVA